MSRSVYRVHLASERPELLGASTFGRDIAELEVAVREVVVLAANLPDDALDSFDLEWVPESASA